MAHIYTYFNANYQIPSLKMSDLWLFYHFCQLLTAVTCPNSFSYVCFNFIYVLFAFPNSIYIYFGAIYIFLILYLFYPMCDIATYRAGALWPAKKCRTVAMVTSIVFVFERRVIVTSALPNINLPLANFYSFQFTENLQMKIFMFDQFPKQSTQFFNSS